MSHMGAREEGSALHRTQGHGSQQVMSWRSGGGGGGLFGVVRGGGELGH